MKIKYLQQVNKISIRLRPTLILTKVAFTYYLILIIVICEFINPNKKFVNLIIINISYF